MEEWLPIDGYDGLYEVSSLGRVRSTDRVVSTFNKRAGRVVPLRRKQTILRQSDSTYGYFTVSLCKDGVVKTARVAGLVRTAFYGPRPEGMQACHNDGVKANNTKENLRWDTAAANQLDRIAHKTDLRGEQVVTAKLSAEQVAEIKAGIRCRDATRKFGISASQFYRIRRGDAWAHVMPQAST